ncbi:hypothetical protein SK128_017487 [Halocaridina rubra]|uniref:Uncharacterized protein n=1 Tax=Halocaridina rubra TaxID=373956 RepID=A0AAN8ZW53_HALRR
MGFQRLVPISFASHKGSVLDFRFMAASSALYTLCSSLLVVFLYSWRFTVNSENQHHLHDVYWGVQLAYMGTIVAHLLIIILSVCLIFAIFKERTGIITQWVVVNISLMAFEAVCCCYSNVLRDHINHRFDAVCKAEIVFFISRLIFNVVSLWCVMKFLRNIHAGKSYRPPEVIEL